MSVTATTSTTLATPTPTVDTSNFANNAFTDFAPLLTLFGDEVTKQFLSSSTGWADSILLGLAPIGAMTIIVSAIRVGGDKLLKSFIGRARDSPDDEEKEILLSTSSNVREIWDGNRVVRQTGSSQTVEFILWTGPYPTTSTALSNLVDHQPDKSLYPSMDISYHDSKRDTGSVPRYLRDILAYKAPNITLNIANAIPEPGVVRSFMWAALVLQSAVIVINAVVVYHLKLLRAKSVVAGYGFPLWLFGTLSLILGITICSRIVQTTTSECRLHFRVKDPSQMVRIIRLQKKIPEMSLPAYAIKNGDDNFEIRISQRIWPDRSSSQSTVPTSGGKKSLIRVSLAYIGICLTLAGFVCQNIGTRELHWSASVLQLGATLVISALRAFSRHHLGDDPQPYPIPLEDGLEAAHLTSDATSACVSLPIAYYVRENPHNATFNLRDSQEPQRRAPLFIGQTSIKNPENNSSSILQMLKLHEQFSRLQPVADKVFSASENLCKAVTEIYDLVDESQILWFQHLSVLNKNGITKASYIADQPRLQRDIAAIIDLARYHASKQVSTGNVFSIVAHCEAHEAQKYIQKIRQLAGLDKNFSKFVTWQRTSHGALNHVRYDDGRELVLSHMSVSGLQYGAEATKKSPFAAVVHVGCGDTQNLADFTNQATMPGNTENKFDAESKCHEIARVCRQYRGEEQHSAIGLFMGMFDDLATIRTNKLKTLIQKDGWDGLAKVLMKHGVCEREDEAKLAVLLTLIKHNMLPEIFGTSAPQPSINAGASTKSSQSINSMLSIIAEPSINSGSSTNSR